MNHCLSSPAPFPLSDSVYQQMISFHPMKETDPGMAGMPRHDPVSVRKYNRLLQFNEGRKCAAMLLAKMGSSEVTVGTRGRAPVWPSGFVGSITHTAEHIGVAVASQGDFSGIGIDIETIISEQVAKDIEAVCMSSEELKLVSSTGLPRALMSTACFSAKESLFKCLYPLVDIFFDFLDVRVSSIDINLGKVEMILIKQLSDEFRVGDCFVGGVRFDTDRVYTAFELRNSTKNGVVCVA